MSRDDTQATGPIPFLTAVARAYTSTGEPLDDCCFVFPNKRSGTFFLKSLSESLGDRAILAPDVMDVAELMERISQREAPPRIDMLFRLYRVYCALAGKSGALRSEADLLDFDRFAPWGEVILEDFSEVDQYDVDAAALFRNVRDYRDIASNFLTEEQCAIIERYFGYRPAAADVEQFWRSVGPEEDRSRIKEKFISLWQLLPELYAGLSDDLEADGLAMPGTTFRRALRRVEEEGRAAIGWRRIVAVGFNMLSATEARLFARLRDMRGDDGQPVAEFFWDATGPVLAPEGAAPGNAARAMRRNIRNFPMPEWALPYIAESQTREMPRRIITAASPSNAAQAKIASLQIAEWRAEYGDEMITDARTALVIPDENLLMPVIHSLPENLPAVNLTMGYSMRYTSTASFIYHLRRLQTRRRRSGGQQGYYHADFRLFLAHPLVHAIIGSDTANGINTSLMRQHLRIATLEWIEERSAILADILRPLPADMDVDGTIAYIDSVLVLADRALAREEEDQEEREERIEEDTGEEGDQKDGSLPAVNTKIERSQIAVYRMAMSQLQHSVSRHGIEMRFTSVFHLVDRLVAGEKVNFRGEPLAGLQLMGMLETRAIDFDHLVIMSMNDKVMPRRSRKRTFVPDSLRKGYGLPTASQGEELYSYYFYRLLSRARNVTLIYDARAGEGMRSGGKSRYLMQLEMLYARGKVLKRDYSFRLDSRVPKPQGVVKTDSVMEKLGEFLKEKDGRNLSASALMNYCMCPVMFYYRNVVNLNDDPEPTDYINPITQGNIVHDTMLQLYFPEDRRNTYLKGSDRIMLSRVDLQRILDDREGMERILRANVNRHHFELSPENCGRELTGSVKIVAERLLRQVADVVRHDMSLAPLELIGGEMTGNVRWRAGNSPEVNIRYAFDRVDRTGGRLRVVDYKTGSPHVDAKTIDEVFDGSYGAKYMLQLLLYAHLLEERVRSEENAGAGDIAMEIYDVNSIASGGVIPKVGGESVLSHQDVKADFTERMERMLKDIFDPSKDFEPTDDEENCRFCKLKALCGRE